MNSQGKDLKRAQTKMKPNKSSKLALIAFISIVLVIAGIVSLSLFLKPGSGKTTINVSGTANLKQAGDLVIPVSSISAKATFYPVTVDGTKLEVLAVMAPDKTIRTAFNTCQVCYDSGRGYYKQEGDVLVCQNCGNRFKISQVEVSKGGCNPVPIFDKEIQMGPENITVPAAYLKEAKDIFKNWKTA